MRVHIFFLLMGVLSAYAGKSYSQETLLTFELRDTSIRQVLLQIERSSSYMFVLADNVNDQIERKVNIDVNRKNIRETLTRLFHHTNLLYEIIDKQVVVYLKKPEPKEDSSTAPTVTPPAEPEQSGITVKGHIADQYGTPLIGAAIMVKGNNQRGSITDIDGNFTLDNLPPDATLVISYLGYQSVEYPLRGRTNINVALSEDQQVLNEVVVVGYGTQQKATLTGSIATVKSESLVQSSTANISSALVGRIPGIMSNQASGEAGDNATTIRIRGVATLNSGGYEPLIVIDGVQASIEVMNALDANEIQNVSVLKDASATAVYGVKGANGVIIVTTKRGDQGKPRISLSYRYGVTQLVSQLQMLGSYEYALFRNEAIRNDMDGSNNSYLFSDDELWKFQHNRDYTPDEVAAMSNLTAEQKEALLNSPALYYSSHNYFDEQFGALSPQEQYNINVSGGSDRMKYFVSVGYFSQDGVFKNSNYGGNNVNSSYERYNVRSNLDIDVVKNLKVSIDFGGQFATKQGILGNEQDGVTSASGRHKAMLVTILANTPFTGPGIIDGKLVSAFAAYQNPLQGKGANGYSALTGILTRDVLRQRTSNLSSTLKLTHTMDYITKGLSFTGTLSYNDTYTKGVQQGLTVPVYTAVRNPDNPAEILFFGGRSGPGWVSDNVYNSKWNRLYLEAKVDYVRTFGEHSVTGLLLYNAQKTKYPGLRYNVPQGLIGVAARATYRYADRYVAEFNMGYNGSENFPEGKRFGFFPAFSVGWIASNEAFFPKSDWVTWLKLRASYGEVGNDQIGGQRFLYLPSTWAYTGMSGGNGYFFGNTNGSSRDPYYNGAYEATLGNPDVTWERARKVNIGLDVNFLRDRLQFVGDLFLEKRDNILWSLGTVPGIVAAQLPPANIGKVTNKGYELSLKWTDRVADFEYSIGGNVSYAVNRIDYMDEPSYPYEWMNTTGFALGQYKGFRTEGFYNNSDEASNRPYVSLDGNKVQAGDIRYIDIDGDGVIDSQDKVPIGYSNLPRFSFGANIDLAYKGFYASILFTGSAQGSMPMTSFYILNPFYMINGAALQWQYDGRWTEEKVAQGITPTFPRASVRTYDSQNGAMNDMWLRSSQFFRLKNVEVGYNFTKLGALRNVGISGIRVYLNGNNLATWGSKLISGYDPEQQDSGGASDGYLYPPTRTYNFGVNVQF